MYVHEVQRGYQVQMYVPFANGTKRLVHHGIFQDLRTAALAQSVASSDLNAGNGPRERHYRVPEKNIDKYKPDTCVALDRKTLVNSTSIARIPRGSNKHTITARSPW